MFLANTCIGEDARCQILGYSPPGALSAWLQEELLVQRRRESEVQQANMLLWTLPRTQRVTLTMIRLRQSLKNRDQNLQEEGRRQDKSAGVSVMLLQNFCCPVEPFQRQQSPGQKPSLASQGLSVKEGCLGCKRSWDGLFPLGERELRRRVLTQSAHRVPLQPPQGCGWKLSRLRIFHQTLMGKCPRGPMQRLLSIPDPRPRQVIIQVYVTSHQTK